VIILGYDVNRILLSWTHITGWV